LEDGKMVSCKQYFLLALSFSWWTTCIHVTSEKHSLKPGEELISTNPVCSENGYYRIEFGQINTGTYLVILGPKE